MKAYISYFKLKFISGLQYRSSAIAGMCTQFFFGIIYIMVFVAFYESGSKTQVMALNEVITYLWLNQAFFGIVNQRYRDTDIINLIKTGNLSYELARPKDIYFMWYFKILGERLAATFLRSIPLLLVVIFLPEPYNLGAPSSIMSFLLFIISFTIGALLVAALNTLIPLITIRTMSEKGVVSIYVTISEILSGTIVPIPFFPKFLAAISALLPFQYVSDLPFRLYVGNIPLSYGIEGILIQAGWLVIILGIGKLLLNISLKKVVVQGG